MFELILFRGVQGIGGGILLSLPFIVVGEIFTPLKRAKYMGLLASVFALADVIGLILGGVITDFWSWIFFINVPIGIVAITIIYYSLPNFKIHDINRVIDYWGILLFTLAISSMFIAVTYTSLTLAAGLISLIILILFIIAERKSLAPILPLNLFKTNIFTFSSIESLIAAALMFGGVIYIPLFAQGVLGINAADSGLFMIPMLFSVTITSIITGQIMSKTGKYKRLIITDFIITLIGVTLLSTMNVKTPLYLLLIYSVVLGIGSGMAYTIFTVIVQNAFTYREIGVVTVFIRFF